MARLDRSFVNGVFWRMLALGALLALMTGWAVSLRFGYSMALGTLFAALSLRATAFVVRKMFNGAINGNPAARGGAVVLVFKLAANCVAIWFCLSTLGAHAVGFILGYKVLLLALGWQTFSTRKSRQQVEDNAADNEST
ncbi:hypothetical protein DL240_01575 [Lujinxingia litoralis]|uniref:Uncharacterized protein n=1 Tax=Lujinxingia litoralis TaxID=2211119 RepID=A0A328C8Z1_9DELT|nr:hypothetical protein [Lujinxingia litoralis]RAL24925.1 hypothetical protein DL240_01575 [Lujinxingia litoralis]